MSATIQYEKIIPISDRILVRAVNIIAEGQTENQSKLREIATKRSLGQYVLPFETTIAMNDFATVCCVTPDCRWVSEGDLVMIGKYSGTPIMIESEPHLMIRESDVLFILKP